jgi:tRNA dimethylallyltransferase
MSIGKPILIAGATASGKSALALALADELGGVIINADSMQVYSELRILTARPSAEEESRVPHRLYGHVPAAEAYSAGRFIAEAAVALEDAKGKGLRPIIVGGTGLYFKALLEGLSPIPSVDDSVRAHWRGEAERLGAVALHAVLVERDPEMARRLAATDTQRIVRALEILESSGRSLGYWQSQSGTPVIAESECVKLLVSRPRADLHARADARFEAMVARGGFEEAKALAALGLDPALPAMRALGVAPLIAAARGEIALDAAIVQGKAETRQFIKRQETWSKRYMIAWIGINTQLMQNIAINGFAFIDSEH